MIYLAAPFFNPPQLQLVKEIERVFEIHGINYFSPRKQHGEKPVPIRDKAHAKEVFTENWNQILANSSMVLAVMDYLMPDGSWMFITRKDQPTIPVQLPDTGTVWEMGAAFAIRTPVVLFTNDPARKMNLMLACSALGVIKGLPKLDEWCRDGCGPSHLEEYEGAYT